MTRLRRLMRMLLISPRLLPHICILMFLNKRSLIRADLARWAEILGLGEPRGTPSLVRLMIELMTLYPEYRNVFYLRCGTMAVFVSWACRPLSTLSITPSDIGPGLFIQHGVATLVSAERIGANC
jgi:serine O-acetyltransferase